MLKSDYFLIFLPLVQNWKLIHAMFKLIMVLQGGIKNEEKIKIIFRVLWMGKSSDTKQ